MATFLSYSPDSQEKHEACAYAFGQLRLGQEPGEESPEWKAFPSLHYEDQMVVEKLVDGMCKYDSKPWRCADADRIHVQHRDRKFAPEAGPCEMLPMPGRPGFP